VNEDDMSSTAWAERTHLLLEEEKRCPTVQTTQSPTSITL